MLSLFIERALSPLFEWRIVLDKIKDKGVKEPVAFAVSLLVIYVYKFDAMAVLFSQENTSWIGYALTAAIVAGGSKGSIKLFRDWMDWKSTAQKEYEEEKKKSAKPQIT